MNPNHLLRRIRSMPLSQFFCGGVSTKHQAPSAKEPPRSKSQPHGCELERVLDLAAACFSGAWCLVLGALELIRSILFHQWHNSARHFLFAACVACLCGATQVQAQFVPG